jgi:hypothetical protein
MRIVKPVCAFLALVAASGASRCADFENDLDSMSVKTPKGTFECINGKATDHKQVLRLAGRVIYEQVPGPAGIVEDSTLRHGIVAYSTGCPWVVAVRRGRVVIGRDLQPPFYGVQDYAVIDFNKAEPSLAHLASGQRPEDDSIAAVRRIEWSDDSLVLSVFGYAPDVECCTKGSPAPKAVRVRYTYANGSVEVVR